MPELEDGLRAEVTQRMQDFAPSADLPDRIHVHVRRRRRERQVLVGAVSAGACVALVAVGAFLVSPGEAVEVSDPALPGTTASTGSTGPTASTGPVDTTAPSDEPGPPSDETGPTRSPGTTAPTPQTSAPTVPSATTEPDGPPNTFTSTTEPHGGELKPPDNDQPTNLPCPPAAEIVLGPEGAAPPCAQVTADQRLQVRNDTDVPVTVSVGGFVTDTVQPGASAVIGGEFGGYLEPGAHFVDVSPYDPALPEIWFVP